ncbi:MAG: hypothetical protein AAFW73_12320 [Bacteroidota bacterium]
MDYSKPNFTPDEHDEHDALPEGFAWEDMKAGIFDKMQAPKPRRRRPWPLLLLLFMGACGVWFRSQHAPPEDTAPTAPLSQTNTGAASTGPAQTRPPLAQSEPSLASSARETQTAKASAKNAPVSARPNRPKTTQREEAAPVEAPILPQPPASAPNLSLTPAPLSHSATSALTPLPSLAPEPLPTVPASVELPSPAPPASKSTASPFQPRLSWALIGGIQYWHQNDKNNPNTFYLSPFPSYSFSPQVSWQFQPQRSLSLGYRYQTLEELFDYEGTRISEKFLKDVVVGEVVNSLTNARVAEVRKDTFVQVTQYNRELRYNQFQLHNLYFTFDQKLWVRDRAFLQVSAGFNYLLRLRAQGKRLDEQRAVRAFQYGDERFRNHRFALQLGLRYQLQLLPQWQLIAQLDGQQYLNDWERNPALRNRPLLYGLSIGVGGHF